MLDNSCRKAFIFGSFDVSMIQEDFDRQVFRIQKKSDDEKQYKKQNTGIRLEWLQEHLLIPLDIFRLNLQNKGINNELDAWLTFLSADEPEMIEQLIKTYPQFKPMY